jgi:hypothetical protein
VNAETTHIAVQTTQPKSTQAKDNSLIGQVTLLTDSRNVAYITNANQYRTIAWKKGLYPYSSCIFLIGILGGGVQLGPLGTAATNRPIVPAPGIYDDGEIGGIIGKGNRSTLRKPAALSTTNPTCSPGREPGPRL